MVALQTPGKVDLVITRIIDAPLERVWQAWTEPQQVIRWWGPAGYTSPSCMLDFREGGRYIFCMRAPHYQGGRDSYMSGVYNKIVPLERIEFTQNLSGPDGRQVDPLDIGMPPDFPGEVRTTLTFRRVRPDMTEISIREHGWTPGPMYVHSLAGLHQSIDKLAESLK